MAKEKWTSNTIPKPPTPPEGFDEAAYSDIASARWKALQDLLKAEEVERQAAALRGVANQSVEHYRTLLETLTTDPLFEVP